MSPDERPSRDGRTGRQYEAPQIDSVLTPEEVEREVHYAGEATQDVLTN